jgi:exopolysaccharide production protein ExoQ
MSANIALALTLVLVVWLLRRDVRQEPRVSPAVWIPVLWLLINGSRQVSMWLEGGPVFSMEALSEGNALDKTVYSGLIVAGLCVLASRRVALGEIFRNNTAIVLFFAFGALSIAWSDEPLTSTKRWVKAIGDPVMVLVLWSDPAPVRAVVATLRRCAYVLIPFSLLFCKFLDHLGRTFDAWGRASYTGVTTDKNMFGYLLFAFGLFFVASLLAGRQGREDRQANVDLGINLLMVAMVAWMLPIANSKTATVALGIGVIVVFAARFETVRRNFLTYAVVGVALAVLLEQFFSIKSAVLQASGRDATLTGRTGLWEMVLQEPNNPLIGVGYSSFWLGERLERFWSMYPTSPPIQAHNGYIEIYINLGLIGLTLMAAVLWSGLKTMRLRASASVAAKAAGSGTHDLDALALFGLGYCIAYLFYNISEATFQGLNPLFTIFLMLAFDSRHISAAASADEAADSAADTAVVQGVMGPTEQRRGGVG